MCTSLASLRINQCYLLFSKNVLRQLIFLVDEFTFYYLTDNCGCKKTSVISPIIAVDCRKAGSAITSEIVKISHAVLFYVFVKDAYTQVLTILYTKKMCKTSTQNSV